MLILHPRAVYLLDCGPIRRVGDMKPNLIACCWTCILKLDDTVNCQPSQIRDYRLFAQTGVGVSSYGAFFSVFLYPETLNLTQEKEINGNVDPKVINRRFRLRVETGHLETSMQVRLVNNRVPLWT